MAGLCGVVPDPQYDIETLTSGLQPFGHEHLSEWRGEAGAVTVAHHTPVDQPASPDGDESLLWLWGEVFGTCNPTGHVRRPLEDPDDTAASYCVEQIDRHGIESLAALNGEFAGCLYDPENRTLSIFTDRCGFRPVYYTMSGSNEFVFSTDVQSIPAYDGVETGFDADYLTEYLTLRRTFGVKTPLSGIERIPPGSILHVDLETGARRIQRYWYPRYEPISSSFDRHLERFIDVFLQVLADRVDRSRDYGLLLSGGGDSRLILAGMRELDLPVTAYHMNDWVNQEARIAQQVAETADVELRYLWREDDYQVGALERNPKFMDFVGWFNQAHASGFADQLIEEIDVVLSGHLAGETIKRFDTFYPERRIGAVPLPSAAPIETVADFIDLLDAELPPYLNGSRSLREILEANLTTHGGRIDHHGVSYESLEDLLVFNELYPATNDGDYFNYRGLTQQLSTWSPFMDPRILEFARHYPIEYRFRRDLRYRAIERLSPALAEIPDANTGVPLTRPFPVHYSVEKLHKVRRNQLAPLLDGLTGERTPEPHYGNGSWQSNVELMREDPFIFETLTDRKELLEEIPLLGLQGAWESYRDHLQGANNKSELYTLIGLLSMPATESILRRVDPVEA